jgi:hypothetical protein
MIRSLVGTADRTRWTPPSGPCSITLPDAALAAKGGGKSYAAAFEIFPGCHNQKMIGSGTTRTDPFSPA